MISIIMIARFLIENETFDLKDNANINSGLDDNVLLIDYYLFVWHHVYFIGTHEPINKSILLLK